MEDKDIIYAGIFLSRDSSNILKKYILNYLQNTSIWNDEQYKIICHHMTIAFGSALIGDIKDWCDNHYGQEYELLCTHIGLSDKAIAMQVQCNNVPSTNDIKHITLAVNIDNNGKPVDSNKITNWLPIDNFIIIGKVKYFFKEEKKKAI